MHPGSPPGWESQHVPGEPPRTVRPRAPRQPAGVGVSTSYAPSACSMKAVHPGSPPGWESQPRRSPTPTRPRSVHPGSPPGWESQLEQPVLERDAEPACTPAARRGGSLNAVPAVFAGDGARQCTPAARRGGSLNPLAGDLREEVPASAPRQPAGVGVSTSTSGTSSSWARPCTPAARRGGSLNFKGLKGVQGWETVHPGSPPGWESQRHRRPGR